MCRVGFGLCDRSSSPACRGDWLPASAPGSAAHANGDRNAPGSRCRAGLTGLLLLTVLGGPLSGKAGGKSSPLAPSPSASSPLAPLPTSGRASARCSRIAGAWRERCTWMDVTLPLHYRYIGGRGAPGWTLHYRYINVTLAGEVHLDGRDGRSAEQVEWTGGRVE